MPHSNFRSSSMTLCEMLLHTESAFDCMVEMGYFAKVEFIETDELVPGDQNRYLSEVQRCVELNQILRRLKTEIDKYDMKVIFFPDIDLEDIPRPYDLKRIEDTVRNLLAELERVEQNYLPLRKARYLKMEEKYVLENANDFLTGERNTVPVMAWSDSVMMQIIHDEVPFLHMDSEVRLGFVTGTVPVERFHSFEIMLWRVCRSNFYLKHNDTPVEMYDTMRQDEALRKYVFILFFVGSAMREKIAKICQGFRATLFECPESKKERNRKILEVTGELQQFDLVFDRSDGMRQQILAVVAGDWFIWKVKIKKIQQIYSTLNLFGRVESLGRANYLKCDCWIISYHVDHVRRALMCGAKRALKGDLMMFPPIVTTKKNKERLERPTHFPLNKFTLAFQNVINAYGTASYKELNPAPYTMITFPFLFAVMFGDFGHGLIMTIFAVFAIINEKKFKKDLKAALAPNEVWNILFSGRYIIVLMGLFSMYTGLVYNDMFSKSLNLFDSHWRVNFRKSELEDKEVVTLDPIDNETYFGAPYVFGIDPIWDLSGEMAITTYNSLKMKLAIILGVCQMVFGYSLAAFNFYFFRSKVDLYLVFIPQITFLLSLFGYLVFLILAKWCWFGAQFPSPYNPSCAPSILITFINMLLMKGLPDMPEGCHEAMYEGQEIVQFFLLMVALICVPVLLAGKPLHVMNQRRKLRERARSKSYALKSMHSSFGSHKERSFFANFEKSRRSTMLSYENEIRSSDMSEIWIHQGILCIESILGAVSHTASYLRLWALSLAHDQLSSVLWDMVLRQGLETHQPLFISSLMLSFSFSLWATLTICILVVMEGLSAFLHTLRLHWVEFQSKFFSGTGTQFTPLKFEESTAESIKIF